ncbi:hypothetical protein [Rhizobium sp. 9140]|uniref:hypothetical protein n=1 Tax=Rhizobium sp. 9140 TaxID=1761900 RepID=UPI0007981752|nr:hypothetical protein [Rhizobium sp. 9140]CZT33010.1 hypothetical protein GA0004734_00000380 [Rhizobium sp. 9140]
MKELIMSQLLPQVFDFLILGLLAMTSLMAKRWFGINIEAKHRDALQSALANGARLLLQPGGTLDDAVDYVLRSVPDALKRFGKTSHDDIRELLEPHVLNLSALPGSKNAEQVARIDRIDNDLTTLSTELTVLQAKLLQVETERDGLSIDAANINFPHEAQVP